MVYRTKVFSHVGPRQWGETGSLLLSTTLGTPDFVLMAYSTQIVVHMVHRRIQEWSQLTRVETPTHTPSEAIEEEKRRKRGKIRER